MSHGTFLAIVSWVKTSMMPSLTFGWEEVSGGGAGGGGGR